MIEKLTNLINVKSIITIIFSIAFVVFVGVGVCKGETFEELLKVIIYFYFGTQVGVQTAKLKGKNN